MVKPIHEAGDAGKRSRKPPIPFKPGKGKNKHKEDALGDAAGAGSKRLTPSSNTAMPKQKKKPEKDSETRAEEEEEHGDESGEEENSDEEASEEESESSGDGEDGVISF